MSTPTGKDGFRKDRDGREKGRRKRKRSGGSLVRRRRRVSPVELVPKLVQHVHTSLVLGNPKDELGALRGRQNALRTAQIRQGTGGG